MSRPVLDCARDLSGQARPTAASGSPFRSQPTARKKDSVLLRIIHKEFNHATF
jgi:hypothetical protein